MSGVGREASWRDPILERFAPELAEVARLTVALDPDLLLTEQGVLDGIRDRGFEVIPFEDPVAFRFAYESRYRQVWDRGERTTVVVVLRTRQAVAEALPFDLLAQARRDARLLSFSIAELFPNLDPRVVASLERSDLDRLYCAQEEVRPERLGENDTADFVLRHVFDVASELVRSEPDLLKLLLRRHYRRLGVPALLDDRLLHQLECSGRWKAWPLRAIVPDRAAFLAFLQERWPRFVQSRVEAPDAAEEESAPCTLRFEGPVSLPFDHDDVRVYVDNLFVEGHLSPTDIVSKGQVGSQWLAVGVTGDPARDDLDRWRRLLDRVERELPGEIATSGEWIRTAQLWAEATALRWRLPADSLVEQGPRLEAVHDRIEAAFESWMQRHYASLHNVSYLPRPVMVHQIAHYLDHVRRKGLPGPGAGKIALVVVDGLALDQWVLLRDDLMATGIPVDDGAAFAWVPTLTAVSRQAIFAGDPPLYFSPSIGGTHKEEAHWRRFWDDRGTPRSEVAYVKQGSQADEAAFLAEVREAAERPRCRVLGVVVGTIDQAMHGSPMGTGGLHASVRHWSEQGRFRALVTVLLEAGFEVTLTADHGNIQGTGMGKPNVGAIADERGERVHVFRDDGTRERVRRDFEATIVWPQIGLPEDYRPLIAAGRRVFLPPEKTAVAHGGIAMEEVIVPLATIRRPA